MKEFVEKLIGRLEIKQKIETSFRRDSFSVGFRRDSFSAGVLHGYRDTISTINKLAEEYSNGWIDCDKELPKEAKLYEVTIEKTICSKKQYITDYRLFSTENEWISADKVIAWREKVAPYKKGE